MTAKSLLRTRWAPIGGAAAALALVAGLLTPLDVGSAAVDATRAANASLADAGLGSETAAAVAPSLANMEFVAFSNGCRFLDTRVAGGPLAAGEFRDLSVKELPTGLGPCSVPWWAKGVQVSLSTVAGSPTGTGYARLGPGGTPPAATVLQFTKGQPVSVTTNTALDEALRVRIASLGAGAGYVGDLLGYWEAPVYGTIAGDGTYVGEGIEQVVGPYPGPGEYVVWVERWINSDCTILSSPAGADIRVVGYVVNDNGALYFEVREYNSATSVDAAFSFELKCPADLG